ncbi:hypothetical protein MLD38_005623 [Melastoma candidum]|nr:hypothetical protein MLD38_005623 [Melastoma candidum]
MSPTTCVTGDSEETLYVCRDGNVLGAAADASSRTTWRVLSRLPADVACPAHVTTWRGKVMVIGSARFGEPHMGYFLEVNNNSSNSKNKRGQIAENGNKCTWIRVEFQEEFSGHVQSGCRMEI